jgi:hypothetical protein
MPQPYTEAEITDFLAQLDGFRSTLSPRQQRILDELLRSIALGDGEAGIDPDLEGFQWRPKQEWSVDPKRIARAIQKSAQQGT